MFQPSRNGQRLLAALCFCASSLAFAFGPNRDQPIHVASDRAELDDQKGISTYTGDVIITQGLSRLQADQVEIHTRDGAVTKIVATGNPAHYEEQESDTAPRTHAYANTIVYTEANEGIELQKSARLEQGQNSFQGDLITYDTVNRKVTAAGGGEGGGGGRVEMIFHPRSESERNSGEAAQ